MRPKKYFLQLHFKGLNLYPKSDKKGLNYCYKGYCAHLRLQLSKLEVFSLSCSTVVGMECRSQFDFHWNLKFFKMKVTSSDLHPVPCPRNLLFNFSFEENLASLSILAWPLNLEDKRVANNCRRSASSLSFSFNWLMRSASCLSFSFYWLMRSASSLSVSLVWWGQPLRSLSRSCLMRSDSSISVSLVWWGQPLLSLSLLSDEVSLFSLCLSCLMRSASSLSLSVFLSPYEVGEAEVGQDQVKGEAAHTEQQY